MIHLNSSSSTNSDRQQLKNYVGRHISNCYGIILGRDVSRLKHQTIIVSVITPIGELNHIAVNLPNDNLISKFQPIVFNGTIYEYQHAVKPDDKPTYSIKQINHISYINSLPTQALTTYQYDRAQQLGMNHNLLRQYPNNGTREYHLHQFFTKLKTGGLHDTI